MEEQLPEQKSPTRTPIQEAQIMMKFQDAIAKAIEGNMITKLDWNDQNVWGFFNGEELWIHLADNTTHQWILSKGDFIGDDWIVIGK